MQISYSKPLDHAWQRMNAFLFNPFDLGKWFVLGFTAWLANLNGGSTGGLTEQFRVTDSWDDPQAGEWASGGLDFLRGFLDNPWAFIFAGILLLVVLAIGLVVLWISSRGHFMFLDNLVHSRAEVTAPWTEYRNEGDSLFLWQVVFALVVFVVMGAVMAGSVLLFFPIAAMDPPLAVSVPMVILAGTAVFIIITSLIFIEFFLTQFVVPIMYRHRVSATEAWKMFLALFREHPGSFVLFGLLYFGIMLALGVLYLALGLLTCCIGLILMALPYIGTVILLPLYTMGRYLSLEFLGQFGDGFRMLQPWPETPSHIYGSTEVQGDGTVIAPQNIGEDSGAGQPGPEDS